jgi:hypothetical protein
MEDRKHDPSVGIHASKALIQQGFASWTWPCQRTISSLAAYLDYERERERLCILETSKLAGASEPPLGGLYRRWSPPRDSSLWGDDQGGATLGFRTLGGGIQGGPRAGRPRSLLSNQGGTPYGPRPMRPCPRGPTHIFILNNLLI